MITPENSPRGSHESVAKLTKGLRLHYETVRLSPENVYPIPPLTHQSQEMAKYNSPNEGIILLLQAMILVDDGFIALINIQTGFEYDMLSTIVSDNGQDIRFENKKGMKFENGIAQEVFLARCLPNHRAELVGFIKKAENHGEHVSVDNLFNIAQRLDGTVGIEALDPKKRIEVFTSINTGYPKTSSDKPRLFRAKNPIDNHYFWAPDSVTIKIQLSNFLDK